jgi:predicted TIM-barrel fold metal-dependent hydrolase
LHPDFAAWENEFDRLWNAGVRGLKIHPDFQKIWLNDSHLLPMFAAAEGRFTMMIHIGDERAPQANFSSPDKLAAIAHQFPRLTLIAAHLGGYRHWQFVVEHLAQTNVFIDTSSTLAYISDTLLNDIRRAIPLDRWLFGSDFPLTKPATDLERVKTRLHLTAAEFDFLLTNAGRFFA